MTRNDAVALICDEGENGATALMKRKIKDEYHNKMAIVLGRFERMGGEEKDDDGWIPLIISLAEGDLQPTGIMGRMRTATRIVDKLGVGDVGCAHQCTLTGMWVWDTD